MGLVLGAMVSITLALSLINLSPRFFPLQELGTTFSVYYLAGHLLTVFLLLASKSKVSKPLFWVGGALSVLMIVCYLSVVARYFSIDPMQRAIGNKEISIIYGNLEGSHDAMSNLAAEISSRSPDLVMLLDVASEDVKALNLYEKYSSQIEYPRNDGFGMAIYSKFELFEAPIFSAGDRMPPLIMSEARLPDGRRIGIVLIHLPPPLDSDSMYSRNFQLRRALTHIKHWNNVDVLVAGDLNGNQFSNSYSKIIEIDDVNDASYGFGFRKSWKMGNPFLWFTLDHVFVKGNFSILSHDLLGDVGADHAVYSLELKY